ncbi:hypothetical protein [Nesterenkonia alba]|uniref:hypothetical protein n=1 Tax=Nesterenkonia alba TaxID=515814 RepID=UPI0003B38DA8|nr:hypothetical protein [Nesterenkonia alba]
MTHNTEIIDGVEYRVLGKIEDLRKEVKSKLDALGDPTPGTEEFKQLVGLQMEELSLGIAERKFSDGIYRVEIDKTVYDPAKLCEEIETLKALEAYWDAELDAYLEVEKEDEGYKLDKGIRDSVRRDREREEAKLKDVESGKLLSTENAG